ncbi:TPA: hypothetical protein N2D99_002074 [Clostridium botulinum]|nr:hypothetical protein [Clostridium botulinum]
MLSKENLQDYYSYFIAKEGTEGFNIIEQFVNINGSIAELEGKLGVATSCMDMDLYKNKHYYIVFDLRKGSPKEKIHSDLEKINFKEFFKCVTNGEYIHYVHVGACYFHKYVFSPLIDENKDNN